MRVFRFMEDYIGNARKVNFLPCGGRTALLKVFERREEFSHLKTMFIADQDMWVFTGILPEYEGEIVFTKGYSIENDLYMDGEHYIDMLFAPHQLKKKKKVLNSLIRWFAFEVELYKKGQASEMQITDFSLLSPKFMAKGSTDISEEFLKSRNFVEPNENIMEEITQGYRQKLKGKLLFNTLRKVFEEEKDLDKEKAKGKVFSDEQIIWMCFQNGIHKMEEGTCMGRIIQAIQQHFSV